MGRAEPACSCTCWRPIAALEQLGETATVGQTGERVVVRLVRQVGLVAMTVGDVATDEQQRPDRAVGVELRHDRRLAPPSMVVVADRVLEGLGPTVVEHLVQRREEQRAVALADRRPLRIRACVTQPLRGRVRELDLEAAVQSDDRVGKAVEQVAELTLAAIQRRLRGVLLVDVGQVRGDARQRAVVVAGRLERDALPPDPVGGQDADLARHGVEGRVDQHPDPMVSLGVVVLGMDEPPDVLADHLVAPEADELVRAVVGPGDEPLVVDHEQGHERLLEQRVVLLDGQVPALRDAETVEHLVDPVVEPVDRRLQPLRCGRRAHVGEPLSELVAQSGDLVRREPIHRRFVVGWRRCRNVRAAVHAAAPSYGIR